MSVVAYVREQGGVWRCPGFPDLVEDSGGDPDPPDPTGNPGEGWWPLDLSAPMSLVALGDPDNFGPTITSFPNTMPASSVASSGITHFEGYQFTGSGAVSTNMSNKTFTNCLWDGCYPALQPGAGNLTLNDCAMQKLVIRSDVNNVRFNGLLLTGFTGEDAIHITNDASGGTQATNIVFNGIHAAGTVASYIGGSGNHFDTIQCRGVKDLVLHNFYFDHGPTFDTLFNATVFLEGANGGNSRALINNGYSRSQGYRHFMFSSSTGVQVKNCWFEDTGQNLLHDGGAGQVIDVEFNNRWADGTPIPTLFGA